MARRAVTPRFDETVHAPHRLRTCALLAAVDSMEFGAVRDELGVADSVLSKQLKVLVDAGYVATSSSRAETGRPRKWLTLTGAGRRAFAGHMAALRELAELAGRDAPAGAGGEA